MGKSKFAVNALLVSVFLGTLVFPTAQAAGAGETYTMRMANITSNDTQERLAKKFIELVKEKSDGRIDGKLYSAGALGSNIEVMRAVQMGSVQATINPLGNLSNFVPQAGVFEVPWLYPGDSFEDMIANTTRAMHGRAATEIKKLAAEKGFHVVSLFGLSPMLIFTRTRIDSLKQMKGQKLRPIPGKEHSLTLNDWGVPSADMSLPEVYTAVQQGVINGFELPPDVTLNLKLHEAAPYVAVTKHSTLIEYIIVSRNWYQSLPNTLKKSIDEAGKELDRVGTAEYAKTETAAFRNLRSDSRVTVVEFTKEDLAKMRELNEKGVWKEIMADPVKGPIFKVLRQDVEELAH
ncbi:MAG: TRAP transporter substrate-binding protein [Burkholderiales bacterium]|nr:TRAP transporter substrate-binding protein [Burkholderiales bacterium]